MFKNGAPNGANIEPILREIVNLLRTDIETMVLPERIQLFFKDLKN